LEWLLPLSWCALSSCTRSIKSKYCPSMKIQRSWKWHLWDSLIKKLFLLTYLRETLILRLQFKMCLGICSITLSTLICNSVVMIWTWLLLMVFHNLNSLLIQLNLKLVEIRAYSQFHLNKWCQQEFQTTNASRTRTWHWLAITTQSTLIRLSWLFNTVRMRPSFLMEM
jgi:hypothetical protein